MEKVQDQVSQRYLVYQTCIQESINLMSNFKINHRISHSFEEIFKILKGCSSAYGGNAKPRTNLVELELWQTFTDESNSWGYYRYACP